MQRKLSSSQMFDVAQGQKVTLVKAAKTNVAELNIVKYVLKRVSFGSKDCTKELKLDCAYFLGQTS